MFLERLKIDKGVEKQIVLPSYDMIDEINNFCIKIPLLQAIKYIPIFAKTISEWSIKKPRWKKKNVKRIQLVKKTQISWWEKKNHKYNDPRSPIENGIEITNT